jgi:hypothetical protein
MSRWSQLKPLKELRSATFNARAEMADLVLVGYWHKADMVVSLLMSAFGGKADIDWTHFNVRL